MNDLSSNYVLIHERGIYLFKIVTLSGVIKGDYKKKTLINAISQKNEKEIPNFFLEMNNDGNKIEKIINKEVTKVIILNNACILEVAYRGNIKVIKTKDAFYHIENFLKNKDIIYSENDIFDIYKDLSRV